MFVVNGLKREELIAANSMIIHELYFDSLAGGGEPSGALAETLTRDFGSLTRWKTEFAATGKALGGGSGWVLLKLFAARQAADQQLGRRPHHDAGRRPAILALDMYEHAYQMDYGARAAAYVDAFMQNIRWANAQALVRALRQGDVSMARIIGAATVMMVAATAHAETINFDTDRPGTPPAGWTNGTPAAARQAGWSRPTPARRAAPTC